MKAFWKKFFKKLWQILVRIFSFAPYIYSLEQTYEHEREKEPEHASEQATEHAAQNESNVNE